MNLKSGFSRVCILLSVLWIIGMGWYQLSGQSVKQEEGIVLSLGDEKEISISGAGIQQRDRQEIKMRQISLIVLPALVLLLIVPVGGWLARGFKTEAK